MSWDDRAKMAQFYQGLKPKIKDAMMITGYPEDWSEMIATAARLDDNFRRRDGEKDFHSNKRAHTGKRHPDEIDW